MMMKLQDLQPSQLYINQDKLTAIMNIVKTKGWHALEPIPVKKLNGELIMTDGHTRALAYHLAGKDEVPTEWEDTEMDWELYSVCVQWCKDIGITSALDLKDRIIDNKKYQILWLKRCQDLREDLNSDPKSPNS